ncbi:MAG: hypothetical protein JWN86_3087 [Planctomycetota bacterium]|nr:hypothetical protein [Planctomycetota bacterium]
MKTVALDTPALTVGRLLREAADDIVFLTSDGEARFALIPVDDGDREAAAIRANVELMTYLACGVTTGQIGSMQVAR